MIRIEHYKLQHFRNITLADLNFENYNVIIGTNNSGKSNFIQSFSFLNYIIDGPVNEVGSNFENGFVNTLYRNTLPANHYFNEGAIALPFIVATLDYINEETGRRFSYEICLGFRNKNELNNPISSYIEEESLYYKDAGKPGGATRIFHRKGDKTNYGTAFPNIKALKNVSDTFSLVRVIQLLGIGQEAYIDAIKSLGQVLKTPVFYFSHTELAKMENKDRLSVHNGRIVAFDLEQEIIGLNVTDHWAIFQAALSHILGISEARIFEFAAPPAALNQENQKLRKVILLHNNIYKSLADLSDGSILLIALIVKVLNSDHDIFFIEEPENSTHPKALVDLINFLQSFTTTKQFIVTSHSIVLLNKTNVDQIITASIDKDGFSEMTNVTSRTELRKRLKSGLTDFSDELFFADNLVEEFD